MNKKIIIAVAGIIIGIIAVVLLSGGGDEALTPVKEPLPETLATVTLGGLENGIAFVTDNNGVIEVQYGLVDAPEGVPQPAHIYAGTCEALGELKYLLDPTIDGVSVTSLDISAGELKKQLPLALAVNASLEEIGTYVACGNIAL